MTALSGVGSGQDYLSLPIKLGLSWSGVGGPCDRDEAGIAFIATGAVFRSSLDCLCIYLVYRALMG